MIDARIVSNTTSISRFISLFQKRRTQIPAIPGIRSGAHHAAAEHRTRAARHPLRQPADASDSRSRQHTSRWRPAVESACLSAAISGAAPTKACAPVRSWRCEGTWPTPSQALLARSRSPAATSSGMRHPSPLRGGNEGGGQAICTAHRVHLCPLHQATRPPSPALPRKGEGRRPRPTAPSGFRSDP